MGDYLSNLGRLEQCNQELEVGSLIISGLLASRLSNRGSYNRGSYSKMKEKAML
jgi:hypothetical protein